MSWRDNLTNVVSISLATPLNVRRDDSRLTGMIDLALTQKNSSDASEQIRQLTGCQYRETYRGHLSPENQRNGFGLLLWKNNFHE